VQATMSAVCDVISRSTIKAIGWAGQQLAGGR
jgi:hypothetical protein